MKDAPNTDAEGYWQVEYDMSKGAAPEPVWAAIETCGSAREAHERARARALMGQRTQVVHKTGGRVVSL